MMRQFLFLVLVVAFVVVSGEPDAYDKYFENKKLDHEGLQVTREEVMHNMERRKAQLEKMMVESHAKLALHHAGDDVMEEQELERIEKRIEIVNKKLERMDDMDERVSLYYYCRQ
mmetsp:Transcript_27121/g.45215  ORF Transcript_27121/g.45215 Transcript_27121/m.45215 type:complete len:115 (+) Transcript_27121:56-400(+)